jgi:hypothetical protein
MIAQIYRRSFFASITLLSGLIIFISNSSFTCIETGQVSIRSSDKKNVFNNEINPNDHRTSSPWVNASQPVEYHEKETYLVTLILKDQNSWVKTPTDRNLRSTYFRKRFIGNGVDHMNINLVNLSQTGLMAGDEIGVFDGIYCVGLAVVEEKNIRKNNISIPSSANDTINSDPTGFIEGHKITLKAYRSGTVYLLYFQTVNDTQDIFEKGGSVFVLINFSRSISEPLPIPEK